MYMCVCVCVCVSYIRLVSRDYLFVIIHICRIYEKFHVIFQECSMYGY